MSEHIQIPAESRVPGTGLTYSQWRNLEKSLNNSLRERFSKVWLEVSGLGTLCITMFPIKSSRSWGLPNYEIIVIRKVADFSLENLIKLVSNKLQ